MKQLSIIIVNYNVVHFLDLCLDSVFAAITHLDAEVIVVDNASSDESCDMVRQKYPEVQLLANTDNVGFAKANNQGVNLAQGEYVCILNPDTVVGEMVFERVYAFAKSSLEDSGPTGEQSDKASNKIGAIGVKLIDGTGKFLPESKRNLPTPAVAFKKLFGKGDSYYATHVSPEGNGDAQILVGAFMFMAKKVYQEAGGFDEQYFMYGEDIDLSYTIEQLGYTNYYLGEETVIHFKGESTAKDKVYRSRFYNAMSIFYKKHFNQNSIESLAVKIGLWFARNFSRTSAISPLKGIATQETVVVISKSAKTVNALESSIGKKVSSIQDLRQKIESSSVLFDMCDSSYNEYIQYMLQQLGKENTYKFIPKNSTFAIGSDSSTGKGNLVKF